MRRACDISASGGYANSANVCFSAPRKTATGRWRRRMNAIGDRCPRAGGTKYDVRTRSIEDGEIPAKREARADASLANRTFSGASRSIPLQTPLQPFYWRRRCAEGRALPAGETLVGSLRAHVRRCRLALSCSFRWDRKAIDAPRVLAGHFANDVGWERIDEPARGCEPIGVIGEELIAANHEAVGKLAQ